MTDAEKLIPELQDWKTQNGERFSIENWTAIEGNIKLAIGYSFLFWPDFVEHEGCVFLKSHFSIETFKHWENPSYCQNYAKLELLINHIHILDLFAIATPHESLFNKLFKKHPKGTINATLINKEQIVLLGNKLREMYRVKLAVDFPNKEFEVVFECSENPDSLEDYQLTFHQPCNENRLIKK